MSFFCGSLDQPFHLCDPSVEYLLRSSILAVIDVEAEGAGDGEGQVGDDGHRVHPGGPWDVLQISKYLQRSYGKGCYLQNTNQSPLDFPH